MFAAFEDTFGGFISDLTDRQKLMDAGMAMAGGAAAGIAVNVAKAKIPFLQGGTDDTMGLLKEGGLTVGLSVIAGALLGAKQPQMVAGAQGALGSRIGMILAKRFLPATMFGCVGCGRRSLAGRSYSYPALQGARVHDEDVLGLRVDSEETEEAMAGIFGAGAY